MTLRTQLVDRINEEGPLPFEDFQRTALYDRWGGFFSGDKLRSTKAGDFLTSPEVSPLFGATLAEWAAAVMEPLDAPRLVEVGAGSGSLLRPLLERLDVEAWAVEASPAARRALESVVPGRVVRAWQEVPRPFDGVVVANELIDNLPVALARRTGSGWVEQRVGVNGDSLVLVEGPAREQVAEWAARFGEGTPEGGTVEVQLEAWSWLTEVLAGISRGGVLVIDYGDTAEGLAPRRSQGTLRTYRAHHLGPDPLSDPGATDITVDVNFTALLECVRSVGGYEARLHRQDDFLTAWGVRERLSELRHRELALARDGDPVERLQVRSLRTEAEALLHPRGLGDFRVLEVISREAPSGSDR